MVKSTESPYHFAHLLQVLKQSLWRLILYTFFVVVFLFFFFFFFFFFPHVCSPGQGQTAYWGQKFDDKRKALSHCPYVASFKIIPSKSDLFTFLMSLYMYISPRQGHTNPWGQTLDVNRKPLSLCPFVASLIKEILILYTFEMVLHMYIAPGQGQTTHRVQTFDVNRKPLSLFQFVAGFKKCFYLHFFMFTICIFRRAGADNPLGSKFWWQQKGLFSLPICCKFQNDLFEFWFYTHFLMFFHMYMALGQGQTTLCVQNSDVTLPSTIAFRLEYVFVYQFYAEQK